VEPEQAGAVEVGDRLPGHLAPELGGRGALAQDGHERPGPTHRLVVVDVGEARARAIGHPRLPAV